MGSILSYLYSWFSPSPPALDTTPDKATGLSEQDKALITSSWALVGGRKYYKQNGVELFVQLFRAYPYMQSSFKDLKDMDESELRNSPKLRAHATNVMAMLNNYVQNLEDTETLVELVKKVAASHVRRSVGTKEFEDLGIMFIPYLRSIVGAQLTPEVKDAWVKLLKTQGAVVKAADEAAGKGR